MMLIMNDPTCHSGHLDREGNSLRGPDFVDVQIDPSWLDFGHDDPLEAERWINPCAACGSQPTLAFIGMNHRVRCTCGAEGQPGSFPAIAAVNWNKSPLSKHPSYEDLPFFYLSGLSIEDARAKLVKIREYLEEQRRRCEWRNRTRIGTGHRYHQRVRAYLVWTVYGLSLLKEQDARAHAVAQPAEAGPVQVEPTRDALRGLARSITARLGLPW